MCIFSWQLSPMSAVPLVVLSMTIREHANKKRIVLPFPPLIPTVLILGCLFQDQICV